MRRALGLGAFVVLLSMETRGISVDFLTLFTTVALFGAVSQHHCNFIQRHALARVASNPQSQPVQYMPHKRKRHYIPTLYIAYSLGPVVTLM